MLSTEPPVILDSDFLSSFVWVNRLGVLEDLYSRRMIVLEEVLEELGREAIVRFERDTRRHVD